MITFKTREWKDREILIEKEFTPEALHEIELKVLKALLPEIADQDPVVIDLDIRLKFLSPLK